MLEVFKNIQYIYFIVIHNLLMSNISNKLNYNQYFNDI